MFQSFCNSLGVVCNVFKRTFVEIIFKIAFTSLNLYININNISLIPQRGPIIIFEYQVCAVAEKTLACYKGDENPLQQTNYLQTLLFHPLLISEAKQT